MRYPCLVPKRLCKTDITCSFEREGLNEYGEPLKAIEYSGKCNYQDKARTVLTAEKKLIQITGTALFPGDICTDLPAEQKEGSCPQQFLYCGGTIHLRSFWNLNKQDN